MGRNAFGEEGQGGGVEMEVEEEEVGEKLVWKLMNSRYGRETELPQGRTRNRDRDH